MAYERLDLKTGDELNEAVFKHIDDSFANISTFVTPEMFGAVGDGVSDDTAALTLAVASGEPVVCRKKYGITNFVINESTRIIGGVFNNLASTNYMLTICGNDVVVEDAIFNGNSKSNGIKLDYVSNITFNNCEVKNIKYNAGATNGIYVNRSRDIHIYNCHIHDILNDGTQATRGIDTNRSNRVFTDYCTIYNIDSGDDADGLHYMFDNATDESNEIMMVSNTTFYNCRKRYMKIQQQNVLIENCTMLAEQSVDFGEATVASISVYDCNCTLRKNYINGLSPIQIQLCGDSSDIDTITNISIIDNVIKNVNSSEAKSQGLITTSTVTRLNLDGLKVIGNTFIGMIDSEMGIMLKTDTSMNNIIITNNIFQKCYMGIYFDYVSNDKRIITNVIITNNSFDVNYNALYTHGCTIYGITATNNTFMALNSFSGLFRFYRNVNSIFRVPYHVNISNNIFATTHFTSTQSKYFTNYVNWYREFGTTAQMPVHTANTQPIPMGFKYFNTELHKYLIWHGNNWYNPDGTVFESAES